MVGTDEPKHSIVGAIQWWHISIIVLIALLIFIIQGVNWGYWFGSCEKTTIIFHNQYVGERKGCCDNCLIMNVTEFVCCGEPGDGCGCQWKNKVYYFEGETELYPNITAGEELWVNWCWIPKIQAHRIRGITKKD